MKRKVIANLLIGCSTLFFGISAQIPLEEWDREMKEKFSLFQDNLGENRLEEAKPNLDWLLANYPNMHKSLYTKGIKVYEGLVKSTEEKMQKQAYQDSVINFFDRRARYFGEEAKVLNLKGYRVFRYWQDRPGKTEEMYDLYKKIVELNQHDTYNQNVSTYMYLACEMKGKREELSDEKIIEIHENLTQIIQFNLKKYREKQKPVYVDAWEKTQTYIDSRLENCVTIDCDFVKTQYRPKFEESPQDTLISGKIYANMIQGKCTDDPFFIEVTEALVKEAPTASRIKVLAIAHKKAGNQDKYLEYMNESFNLGGSSADKADFYLELANDASKKGLLAQARTYANQAKDIEPSRSAQVYNFIGNLYFYSAAQCKSGAPEKAKVYDAVSYFAAYDMFEKAGNSAMMQKVQQYFPSAADIHFLNMTTQIGTQISVGCWIGGTATLRKR